MLLAKKLEAEFDRNVRVGGRALVRQRRTKVLDADDEVACVEVRGYDGSVVVLLVNDRLRACSCDGGTPRARCAHTWAAVLARDRFVSRAREGRADLEDDVDRLAREEIP